MNRKTQGFKVSKFQGFTAGSAVLSIALIGLFTSVGAMASTPQGSFDKTLSVSGPVDLEVFTHSGDVRIRAGSSGSVQIHGKIYVGDSWFGGRREDDVHAIEKSPPIQQNGNTIHIDYVNYRNISIDYDITVPTETRALTAMPKWGQGRGTCVSPICRARSVCKRDRATCVRGTFPAR